MISHTFLLWIFLSLASVISAQELQNQSFNLGLAGMQLQGLNSGILFNNPASKDTFEIFKTWLGHKTLNMDPFIAHNLIGGAINRQAYQFAFEFNNIQFKLYNHTNLAFKVQKTFSDRFQNGILLTMDTYQLSNYPGSKSFSISYGFQFKILSNIQINTCFNFQNFSNLKSPKSNAILNVERKMSDKVFLLAEYQLPNQSYKQLILALLFQHTANFQIKLGANTSLGMYGAGIQYTFNKCILNMGFNLNVYEQIHLGTLLAYEN